MVSIITNIKQKLNIRLSLIIPYLIGAIVFIIFPMVLLLVKAVNPVEGDTLADNLKNKSMWNAIGRSVWLGLLAAFISLILLLPFTWMVARNKSKALSFLAIALIVSPLLVFTIARVFALKILLLKIFDEGRIMPIKKWIMILGMVYLYSPFMIIPLYSVFKNMPKSLIEASHDLGYNSVLTLIKVVIPYSLKAIFSGIGVVFMLSSTTLVITNTLMPAATQTSINDNSNVLIGNVLDVHALNMPISSLAAHQGSTIALVTIAVMMTIYGGIYLIPYIFRKIKGGVNV